MVMYDLRRLMTCVAIVAPAIKPYGWSIACLAVSIMILSAAAEIRDARAARNKIAASS